MWKGRRNSADRPYFLRGNAALLRGVERKTHSGRAGIVPDAAFLTKAALAQRLGGLTARTITSWQLRGLPHVKVSPRLNLYHWESVVGWLMRHQIQVIGSPSASKMEGGAR